MLQCIVDYINGIKANFFQDYQPSSFQSGIHVIRFFDLQDEQKVLLREGRHCFSRQTNSNHVGLVFLIILESLNANKSRSVFVTIYPRDYLENQL